MAGGGATTHSSSDTIGRRVICVLRDQVFAIVDAARPISAIVWLFYGQLRVPVRESATCQKAEQLRKYHYDKYYGVAADAVRNQAADYCWKGQRRVSPRLRFHVFLHSNKV
ncbi:MAG: hypothetical protein ACLTLQ_16525 [[Clostridium] scindens]